jgi:glycosidase
MGMTKVYDILSHDFVYHDLSKMLIFPGNHDTARIGDCVRKDPRALKLAMTMMATMRGIPQIFAGDELMFVSSRPDNPGDHPGLRVDFPGGWEGDEIDLFTEEGRKAQTHNTDGLSVPQGQAADLFDYISRIFQWRKGKEVIHNGKTLHFMTRDNTYGYFRYDETDVVFVYINNSHEPKNIPWTYYSEISEGLDGGVDVLTGEPLKVSDATVVAPLSALVVEYKK